MVDFPRDFFYPPQPAQQEGFTPFARPPYLQTPQFFAQHFLPPQLYCQPTPSLFPPPPITRPASPPPPLTLSQKIMSLSLILTDSLEPALEGPFVEAEVRHAPAGTTTRPTKRKKPLSEDSDYVEAATRGTRTRTAKRKNTSADSDFVAEAEPPPDALSGRIRKWKRVAEKILGNAISPEECQQHYTGEKKAWLKAEDDRLWKVIGESQYSAKFNWKKIASHAFENLRSDAECRDRFEARMKELKPVHAKWKQREKAQLLEAVRRENQNWPKIAILYFTDTGRTGRACLEQYRILTQAGKLNVEDLSDDSDDEAVVPPIKRKDAYENEEAYWKDVADKIFENEISAEKCQVHYQNKAPSWLPEEDERLKTVILTTQSFPGWKGVAELAFGDLRDKEACTQRFQIWMNKRKPEQRTWTQEEKDTLLEVVEEEGKNWPKIALLKYFTQQGRTALHCMDMYNTLNRNRATSNPPPDMGALYADKGDDEYWKDISARIYENKITPEQCKRHYTGPMDKWLIVEEERLKKVITETETMTARTPWRTIAREAFGDLRGRGGVECSRRFQKWMNELRPATIFWTDEEVQKLLWAAQEYHKNWKRVCVKHFMETGRTVDACQQKHYEYNKRQKKKVAEDASETFTEVQLAS